MRRWTQRSVLEACIQYTQTQCSHQVEAMLLLCLMTGCAHAPVHLCCGSDLFTCLVLACASTDACNLLLRQSSPSHENPKLTRLRTCHCVAAGHAVQLALWFQCHAIGDGWLSHGQLEQQSHSCIQYFCPIYKAKLTRWANMGIRYGSLAEPSLSSLHQVV